MNDVFCLRVTKFENGHSTAVIWRPQRQIPTNPSKSNNAGGTNASGGPRSQGNLRGRGRGGVRGRARGRGRGVLPNPGAGRSVQYNVWNPTICSNSQRGGRASPVPRGRGRGRGIRSHPRGGAVMSNATNSTIRSNPHRGAGRPNVSSVQQGNRGRGAIGSNRAPSAFSSPSSNNKDQKSRELYYKAESTRDVAHRQRCHPSYAAHTVSWAPFMNMNYRPKIQQKLLEKQKDIFALSNVLSPSECESLIHLSERHGYVSLISAERGSTGRTNTRVLTDDKSLADMLYERVREFLPKSYRLRDGEWDLIGLNSRFRWCKYVKGQSFKRIHCDKWVDLPELPDQHSFYSVNIYLNEHGTCYSGGRTIIYEKKGYGGSGQYKETSSVSAKTGEVVIFNHFPEKYWHSGETLSSGIKYLLRSDVMYKRRRPKQKGYGNSQLSFYY